MNKFDDQNSFPRFSDDNLVEDDNNIDNITSVTLDYNISDADILAKNKNPTALPTAKPSFNAFPKINQWIQISSCNDNNVTIENGLQSVIPLNRCISNVDNYQIFQLLTEEKDTIFLGYKSYSSMKKCLKKQDKSSQALIDFDPEIDTAEDLGLKSMTFSTLCDENKYKVVALDSIPPIPSAFGYVESYYDSCDPTDDITGYAFLPLNTCLRDESGMILMDRKKDFFVQYTNLLGKINENNFNVQFMTYKSSDGTCTNAKKFSQLDPTFSTCVESIEAIYDADVAMQNLTRESYGCGNFVKLNIATPTGFVTEEGDNDGYFDVSTSASEQIRLNDSTSGEVIALSTIVGILGLLVAAILVYWLFHRNVKPKFYSVPTNGGGTTSGPPNAARGSAAPNTLNRAKPPAKSTKPPATK